jgi:arabinogalactan oligomer/maltooligosaccharide transport system substrate-binding protein
VAPAAPTVTLPEGVAGKVILWHSYRAAERAALEKVVAQFNGAQAAVVIEPLFIPYDAFADKITATIPRGAGPDLFIFAHDRIGDWAQSKFIEPIEFLVGTDAALLGRFFPITVESLTFEKSLYGLPLAFKSVALIYNKKMITEPPKTTDELIAMAKKFTDEATKAYGLVYENANFYHHAAWLYGFGGKVFDEQGKIALNSPEAAQSLAFARDLRAVHKIVPEDVSSILVTSLFNEGKAAMAINGPWFLGEIDPKIEYGVAVLPTIVPANNAPARPFLTAEAVILSAHSANKKAAFEFMKFLTADDSAKIRALEGKMSVANQAVYEDPAIASDAVLAAFRQQLLTAVPMPNTPAMLSVWTPATTALSSVIKGGAAPEKMLAGAVKEIDYRLKGNQ